VSPWLSVESFYFFWMVEYAKSVIAYIKIQEVYIKKNGLCLSMSTFVGYPGEEKDRNP
jgi:hypothetical protein